MKIRMQFAKYGRMLYIGHLDVMRYFQKALRRAGVDMMYSKGYSPHPLLSFAAPLGVGIESQAEYADLEVTETAPTDEMVRRMNAVMVPGMEVLDWRLLPDDAQNAMSSVAAADYCLTFREGKVPENTDAWLDGLEQFFARESVVIEKETKKGSRVLDIRPLIYDWQIDRQEPAIYLQVSTGSVDNLKPELVITAYCRECGLEDPGHTLFISRLETYTNTAGEGEPRNLIPLGAVGARIDEALKEEQPAEDTGAEA